MHSLHVQRRPRRGLAALVAVTALGVVAAVVPAGSAAAAPTAPTAHASTPAAPVTAAAPSGTASADAAARSAASSVSAAVAVVAGTAAVPCASTRELGTKKVVTDLGMSAFTVRQFIGWCTDSRGSGWMNFSSVFVWEQYHARGFAYAVQSGVVVRGEPEARGYTVSPNRQQLSYSTPVRTTNVCTQGWGKVARLGAESPQGLSSLVC